MDTLGGLLSTNRDPSDVVLSMSGNPPREYTARRFRTTAWKTGNFFRHLGVRNGTTVAITDDLAPEPLLAFFGAALLGATVRFDPATATDTRVVVAPTDEIGEYEVAPGGTLVAFGDRPDDPAVAHFETDVWSENPAFPETTVDPDTPVLATADAAFSHTDVLTAARATLDETAFDDDAIVSVTGSLAQPDTVVAGIVAPLLAGIPIRLDSPTPGDSAVTIQSSSGTTPFSSSIDR